LKLKVRTKFLDI